MARLPVYNQRTVASGIPQLTQVQPGQTGQALQSVGAGLNDTANAQSRQQQLLRQKEEEDAASWSADALATAKLDLTTKYTELQQNAGPGAPNFRGNVEKEFDRFQAEAVKNAPNPIAARYLQQRLTAFKADMVPQAMQFEAQARIDKRAGELKSAIDKNRNLVASNPSLFASTLGDVTSTINASGLPEKAKQQVLQDATHGLAFSALSGRIGSDPAGVLQEVSGGRWDNFIDPDNRMQIQRAAETEIRSRQAEAKAAAREARMAEQADISLQFNDALATAEATGKQTLIDTRRILNAYPGKQGQAMVNKLNTAAQIGTDNVTIRSQPLGDDDAFLKSLEPQPGEGMSDQITRYNNAQAQMAAKQKALLGDGASYVYQANDAVKRAWDAANQNPQDLNAAKSAVAITKQAQLDMGVPPEAVKVMPKSQASLLAKQITENDPTKVGPVVDSMVKVYGSAGINDVIAAGAPAETKALAFADMPEQALWRQKLAESLKIKDADLKTQMDARGVEEGDIDRALKPVVAPLLNTTPDAASVPFLNSIKRLAMFNVATGREVSDAVADAWSAFDQQYQFSGTYRVPRKWSMDKVQAGLAGVIGNLGKLNVAPANSLSSAVQADSAYREAETVRSLQNGHHAWITNADETGVIMTYDNGQPVMTKEGKPLEILFDDAVAGKYGSRSARPAPGSVQ